MPSTRYLALLALLTLLATAAPPPRDITPDGFDGGEYQPYDYPPSDVANATIVVDIAANGTSEWTERVRFENGRTAEAFAGNDTLRRAVVADEFRTRFNHPTSAHRSHVAGDSLVVTYRLDGVAHRGIGGGVVFDPFADYGNVQYPGKTDVTFRPPEGYAAVDRPSAFAEVNGNLRWNETTGPDRAAIDRGIVTFAPSNRVLPGLRAGLAGLGVYGPATLRVALGNAVLFGVPLGLLVGGAAAFALRRRRAVGAALAVVALVGVGAFVGQYPVVNQGYAFYALTIGLVYLGLPAMVLSAVGVGLYAVAWRR